MEEEEFEEYLKERYKCQVQWYDNKSAQNQRYYQWFQWMVIIISASVPVLVVSMPDKFKWITAILSIILAIATTALKTFKFQENWVNYRTIAEALKKEKHYYDAEAIEYATAENKRQFFVEIVETLIARENTLWMTTHRRRENSGETQTG